MNIMVALTLMNTRKALENYGIVAEIVQKGAEVILGLQSTIFHSVDERQVSTTVEECHSHFFI